MAMHQEDIEALIVALNSISYELKEVARQSAASQSLGPAILKASDRIREGLDDLSATVASLQ